MNRIITYTNQRNITLSISACLKKVDLVFLIDSSSMVGPSNYNELKNYLKNTITKLDVGPSKVRIGLMQYSGYASTEFPLNMYATRGEMLKAIERMSFMGGSTNSVYALRQMRRRMFSEISGARRNIPHIVIFVTDGGSSNSTRRKEWHEAKVARQQNIRIVSVGVGKYANIDELRNISWSRSNVVSVNTYYQLEKADDQILQKACKGKSFN